MLSNWNYKIRVILCFLLFISFMFFLGMNNSIELFKKKMDILLNSKTRPLNFGILRPFEDFAVKDINILAPDFVWAINGSYQNRRQYLNMIKLLRNKNPKAILGRYNSATTTNPSTKNKIPVRYPLEICPKEWFLYTNEKKRVPWKNDDDRFYLDIRKDCVRKAVIDLAIKRCLQDGLDSINFDNCQYNVQLKNFPLKQEQWDPAIRDFFKEAGQAAHENGLLCIMNIGTAGPKIPEAIHDLIDYVDGMVFETSFHPTVIERKQLDREIDAYEWALKRGKLIFLIPRAGTLEAETFALKKVRHLNNIKEGRIFVTIEKFRDKNGKRIVHNNPLYR